MALYRLVYDIDLDLELQKIGLDQKENRRIISAIQRLKKNPHPSNSTCINHKEGRYRLKWKDPNIRIGYQIRGKTITVLFAIERTSVSYKNKFRK